MASKVNILGKKENARESNTDGNTGILGKKNTGKKIEGKKKEKGTRNAREGKKDRRIEGSREESNK